MTTAATFQRLLLTLVMVLCIGAVLYLLLLLLLLLLVLLLLPCITDLLLKSDYCTCGNLCVIQGRLYVATYW